MWKYRALINIVKRILPPPGFEPEFLAFSRLFVHVLRAAEKMPRKASILDRIFHTFFDATFLPRKVL
jgi:hypothetical protein